MATVKRRRHTQQTRITEEALVAYRSGDRTTLARLLALRPWQASPIDAEGECPWPPGSGGMITWEDSVQLRQELEALAH